MATITSATSGGWSIGATWVGGIAPVNGDKVYIANTHTVTIDTTTCEGGDDTSTAINVQSGGTLKWSRTASSQLTVNGELLVLTGGTFDMGKSADAIPVAYTATLKTNRSAALVDGKWGVTFQDNTGLWIYGAVKNTNAMLVSDIAIGATTARVTDGTGWAIGDRVIFGATGAVTTEQDVKTIATVTLVSGTQYDITWVGGTTYGHKANGIVGNFTNNCVITPYNTTYRSYFDALWNTAQGSNTREMRYVTFEEFATNTTSGLFQKQAAITFRSSLATSLVQPWISIGNIAFYQTNAGSAFIQFGGNKGRPVVNDTAFYGNNVSSAFLCYNGSVFDANRAYTYRISNGLTHGFSEGSRNPRFYDCIFTGCVGVCISSGGSILPEYYRCYFYASNYVMLQNVANNAYFNSCYFGTGGDTPTGASFSAAYLFSSNIGGIGTSTFEDCYFVVGKNITGGTFSSALSTCKLILANKNVDPSSQEIYSPVGTIVRDNTSKVSGVVSLKMSPLSSTEALTFTMLIPAPTGKKVGVSGYLWRDTANVATVTLSGLGITPSTYTASGALSANEQFFVSGTQVTGTDGFLTLTISVTGTTGNMWVDAISAPQSAAIDFGEFGYWANGLPADIVTASYVSAGDVWNFLKDNATVTGSMGELAQITEKKTDDNQALIISK